MAQRRFDVEFGVWWETINQYAPLQKVLVCSIRLVAFVGRKVHSE